MVPRGVFGGHASSVDFGTRQPRKGAKASGAEALAIVGGKVVRAEYGEQTDSQEATCNGDPCTVTTRTGTATVAVDFKVIDARSGKVLLRKTVEDTVEEKTSGQGTPPSIDGSALQDQLLASVAEWRSRKRSLTWVSRW